MLIKTNLSRPISEKSCSSIFNFEDVPFSAQVLQLLIVVFTLFAMCGLKNSLYMGSYICC